MTLPLLLAVYGSLASQGQPSLYQQVIPVTTGRNGYEEYVRAAEMLDNPTFDAYRAWVFKMPQQEVDPEARGEYIQRDQKKVAILNQIRGMDLLDIRREMTRQFGKALDIVRIGNSKEVTDPRGELTPETLFPELASFRRISRLFVAEAYTRFAEGNPAGGTRSLIDSLTFSYKSSGGSIVSGLISTADSAVTIAAFEDHFARLSEKDCRTLISFVDTNIAEPPSILGGVRKELESLPAVIDYALKSPELYTKLFYSDGEPRDFEPFKKAVQNASITEKQAWKKRVLDLAGSSYDRMLVRLKQPEREWQNISQDVNRDSFEFEQPVVKALLQMQMPVYEQLFVAGAKWRTQLRLLGLHGRVLLYKWTYGELPNLLSDAVPASHIQDPLSGEDFRFERNLGGYRLYSKGSDATGEIEIRYKRQATGDKQLRPPL